MPPVAARPNQILCAGDTLPVRLRQSVPDPPAIHGNRRPLKLSGFAGKIPAQKDINGGWRVPGYGVVVIAVALLLQSVLIIRYVRKVKRRGEQS